MTRRPRAAPSSCEYVYMGHSALNHAHFNANTPHWKQQRTHKEFNAQPKPGAASTVVDQRAAGFSRRVLAGTPPLGGASTSGRCEAGVKQQRDAC